MPRRSIWSARQRAARFDPPTDKATLLRHYTLSDDIEHIRVRRGGHNRLGFALQLCAFRYRPARPQSELNPVLQAAQGRATVEKPAPLRSSYRRSSNFAI
ncbi:MAG: DUF4158 domain-containing protein [Chloroflexi bacterium]|nr:DUF4158 domain-containing protein [Chloroflexota bacterium]